MKNASLDAKFHFISHFQFVLHSGYLKLSNLTINGHAGFVATELRGTVSLIPIGFRVEGTIVIPTFTVTTNYDLDINVDNMIAYGTGTIR